MTKTEVQTEVKSSSKYEQKLRQHVKVTVIHRSRQEVMFSVSLLPVYSEMCGVWLWPCLVRGSASTYLLECLSSRTAMSWRQPLASWPLDLCSCTSGLMNTIALWVQPARHFSRWLSARWRNWDFCNSFTIQSVAIEYISAAQRKKTVNGEIVQFLHCWCHLADLQ